MSSSSSLWILMFLLMFILVSTTFEQINAAYLSHSFNNLESDMFTGHAWSGLHAFYWKDSFNFTDSTSFVKFIQQENVKVALLLEDDYQSMTLSLWNTYSKLYKLENAGLTILPTITGTCLTYHPFDDFEIVLALDFSFYLAIRKFNTGRRKPNGQLYSSDFSSLYLDAPFALYQYDSQDNNVQISVYSKPNCTSDNLSSVRNYEGELHMSYLQSMKGNNSLFSERELEFLKFANSWQENFTLKTISFQDVVKERNLLAKFYGFSENSSSEYYQSLFMTECQCSNSGCLDAQFQDEDYWVIPTVVLVVIHYLVLFCSKSFLTPALKSRLLLPYLPFIVIYMEINNSTWMVLCAYPRMLIFSFVITWYIMIYSLTIIRIYYLRNLYHLLAKNRKNIEKKVKFQKTISGPWIGLIFTFFGGFALSAFFSLPFYFVFSYIPIGNATYMNIIIGIYIGVASFVGLFAIFIDLIFNRKKIKEKGLRHVFFFDDPYMIRIELILLSVIIVSIIIFSAIPYSHGSRFFSFVIYCCMVLISGGMATLKNIFNKFLIIIRKNKNHGKDEIEILLQNSDFKNILRDYCTREMSLENFNMFTLLLEMKEKKTILTLEMIKNIEQEYMALNSLFELNVPSNVRKEFYGLLKEMESNGNNSKENELKESKDESNSNYLDRLILLLKDPVLQNLGDTLSRLETTKEFEIWNEIYSIQSKTVIQ